MNLIKNKRFILVAGAVVFLVVIFYFKTQNTVQNSKIENESLAYDGVLVGELVNKDTDLDGVLDWEENLYGTNINKKDTDGDGIPDNVEVSKIKSEEEKTENLTQTEKFSRELFATVAALNQTGAVDQNTVDTLSSSLAEKIQNPTVRKVYSLSDIKTTTDNDPQAIKKYNTTLIAIFEKYKIEIGVLNILKEFVNDGENVDVSALSKLDPIIKGTGVLINGMLATNTPKNLAQAHLDVINALERLMENLNDIKLFDTDPIIAMGAISKYEENTVLLKSTIIKLGAEINKKLSN